MEQRMAPVFEQGRGGGAPRVNVTHGSLVTVGGFAQTKLDFHHRRF